MDLIDKYSLLIIIQHNFQEKNSKYNGLDPELHDVTDFISNELNKKNEYLKAYCDITKSPNMMDYRQIGKKYKRDRTKIISVLPYWQNTKWCELVIFSDHRIINCGVPRGTVLGPDLFLPYVMI